MARGATSLHLLGDFALLHDQLPVPTGTGSRRLLSYVALQGSPVRRSHVAEVLWLLGTGARATANLRAAISRLPRPAGRPLLVSEGDQLRLAPHVEVDLDLARDSLNTGRPDPVDPRCAALLSQDLLPAWDDDWLVIERERHRQLRLHALEDLSAALCREGRYAEALSTALAAVEGEPLRDTARRRVIEVHLAEDNAAEALREYESYRRLLSDELGIAPSPCIRLLVAPLLGRPADQHA